MAADEMQVHLTARNDLERELVNTTKRIQKMEAELRDLGDAQSPEAERRVRQLDKALDKAYRSSKTLRGAVDGLDNDLDQMGYSAQRAGDKTQGMTRDMDKAHRGSKTMAAGWGKMVGVVAGVTAAIGALSGAFRFLGDSINEARAARKAMAQTAAVMKSMGRTESPKALNKLTDSLEAASGIDGDNIREMTNVLLTFGNVTGDELTRANKLALDLSVSLDKDLGSAATMVGKALNDPVKGLTALSRVGVQFTQGQQERIKAFAEEGEVAKAQKIILGELAKEFGGSAKAQADGLQKTQVAWGNLKEAIGDVLMSLGRGTDGIDLAKGIRQATKWIKRHKDEIISVLQLIMSAVFKLISVFLKWQSIVLKTFGYLFGAMATTLNVLAKLGLVEQSTADSVRDLADGFGLASEKADKASRWFDNLSTTFHDAAGRGKTLRDRLADIGIEVDRLNQKKVKNLLRDNQIPGVNSQGGTPVGDTANPMGVGSLGPGGLAAYHAAYSSALGGHSILSGVRGSNLGSVHSDHRYGRAMDVQGPRLGAYAQQVRRSGGYAAMHGTGGNRHLHVVPQTRRPAPVATGGNTFHADVTVVNPAQSMDIQGAVARGLRDAARQTRERG